MAKPLHRCLTKATTAEGDGISHSLNWATSRRGILVIGTDAITCGKWRILYGEIDEAVLYSVRQMFIPGYVLLVKSRGVVYQFGLNWGRFWSQELPFPVRRERARLGYSWYSVAVRLALLSLFIYWLCRSGR